MQTIHANGYGIYFNEEGYQALNSHLTANQYSSLFVIVDTLSHEYCLQRFMQHLEVEIPVEIIEFDNGEANKTIETCLEIWKVLTELGADRKSLIINLGGGVVTDLGGFVATTFKRGIPFVHIPTTLLAMVDAAIGGKNGVDLEHLKNQVGTITNPEMVLVDTVFLETLPQAELRSGLAEMLKHGLVYDKGYWGQFANWQDIDFADFDRMIYDAAFIKNEIVQQDPTEKGLRKALNFGHTLGHAIESYFLDNPQKKTLLHGEAVAIGMILESHLSLQKGLLDPAAYSQIKSIIKSLFETVIFEEMDRDPIIELLIHDKKNESGSIRFVLLDGIGKTKIDQTVENHQIAAAFADYKT